MSTNNKKNIASQALLEMESLKDSIKEESKNTLKSMLADVVKDVLRESVEDDEEEKDYEVVDDEKDAEDNGNDETNDSEESGDVSEDGAMGDEEEPVDDGMDQGTAEAPAMGQEGDMNQDVDAQEAPVEDGEGEDEWSNYSQYQVGDNTYDLTGEEDYDQIVKVYKLMKDEDQVVVKKDGSTLQLQDNGTGAEYVIDLGTDNEMESAEGAESEEMAECRMNEDVDDIACVPGDDSDDDDDEIEDDDDRSEKPWDYGKHFEGKKNRKTMKESTNRKEVLFEVDLGYTDNYQDKDPISGLSNNEPSKSGKSWEKGVPTGTAKPWAGKSKDKGQPFEKTVKEEVDECGVNGCAPEEQIEESAAEMGGRMGAHGRMTGTKSHNPERDKANSPMNQHHVSTKGEYKGDFREVAEAYKRENKALKECIFKLRNGLQEARVTNVNLAKVAKLFVENTVTKEEKINILNRFDKEAKTVEQSNALYESINKELNKSNVKKNLTLENTMKSESSNSLNENKSKDLLNTLDLIRRIENC
jgi:hypothetical protein